MTRANQRLVICVLLMAMLCAGCSAPQTSPSPIDSVEPSTSEVIETPEPTSTPLPEPTISIDEFDIEDIAWEVGGVVVSEGQALSLNYTNNSPYVVIGVDLEYRLKEDLSEEDTSIFADYVNYDGELIIEASNMKIADPGETVKNSPFIYNGTNTIVETDAHIELLEPTDMTVAFIGMDGMVHGVHYGFKNKILSEFAETENPYEWATGGIGAKLPVPDKQVVKLGSVSDDFFGFTIYGCTQDEFDVYANRCVEAGFTVESEKREKVFFGDDVDGNSVSIRYDPIEESITGRIEFEETEEE